jgi:hypothetical protein
LKRAVLYALAVLASTTFIPGSGLIAQTRAELTAELWPRERVERALAALDEQRTAGLISEVGYERRRSMLRARLEGTFTPTMLAIESPLDLIQNGGFESIDRNTRPNRSRWHWWQGWLWEGEYEMRWEDRGRHVRSGRHSARIASTGLRGRIAVFTPVLPAIGDTRRYRFSVWAKGSGENELFVAFDAGASGSVRKRVGGEWELIDVRGRLGPGAPGFRVYLNSTGTGTIWLDDATLAPDPLP